MWPKHYTREMGVDVSREAVERLEIYHTLLLKWQKAINLVSPKTVHDAWVRHFVDSAQMSHLLNAGDVSCESSEVVVPNHVSRESSIVADIGSGAGFPGLVCAILNPNFQLNLVESDERKCQFLKAVSRETGVDIIVHNARIEKCIDTFTPQIVSARALADLTTLLDYVDPWVVKNPALRCLFMKGMGADAEIEAAKLRYHFDVQQHQSLTDTSAYILELNGIQKHCE